MLPVHLSSRLQVSAVSFFFFQAEDGIRDLTVTGVQTCALPISTIGFLRDIQAMPSGFAYSREFFRRYYTPDNATVVVVGDFDKTDTLAQLTKAYSGWKGKVDPAPIAREPRQNSSRRASVSWNAPTLPRLYMAWHGRGADDVHTAAL